MGEAFSPHQGWTEGALWTGDKVSEMILAQRDSSQTGPESEYTKAYTLEMDETGTKKNVFKGGKEMKIMVYKGLVCDVSDWHQRHPGGAGPILGHTGENFGELFDMFHGGWPAPLATLFGLQVGTLSNL